MDIAGVRWGPAVIGLRALDVRHRFVGEDVVSLEDSRVCDDAVACTI